MIQIKSWSNNALDTCTARVQYSMGVYVGQQSTIIDVLSGVKIEEGKYNKGDEEILKIYHTIKKTIWKP